ncbi:MAG: hypothetical protein WDA09_05970, partial [Bacteriovoracaceae bacterium]
MKSPEKRAAPRLGISPKEAREIAEKRGVPITYQGMINWAKKYHLGRKVGGRWFIDKDKLLWAL